jgi:UDP-glucose 4-epimerase
MDIAVTGGAGFIGSHIAEELQKEHEVKVIDNLSSGRKQNIPENLELVESDIKDEDLEKHLKDVDTVFHFAANPKVNTFPNDKDKDFNENLSGTKNVLDVCVEADVNDLVFASSSVVYGEDAEIPTPETANLDPISMYGATKAGAEHMCQVYSNIFDIDLTIVRYANIVGGRNKKGVVYDFVQKLKENPEELEILGNGKQKKSYLHVEDAVEATLTAWEADDTIHNIGSEDAISVNEIADIVSEEMGLDPEYSYTGGKKGWKGDIPRMRLDISKLKKADRNPLRSSSESIKESVEDMDVSTKSI